MTGAISRNQVTILANMMMNVRDPVVIITVTWFLCSTIFLLFNSFNLSKKESFLKSWMAIVSYTKYFIFPHSKQWYHL